MGDQYGFEIWNHLDFNEDISQNGTETFNCSSLIFPNVSAADFPDLAAEASIFQCTIYPLKFGGKGYKQEFFVQNISQAIFDNLTAGVYSLQINKDNFTANCSGETDYFVSLFQAPAQNVTNETAAIVGCVQVEGDKCL